MEGMNAFKEGEWELALIYFKRSYDLFQHSKTAYLITCTYLNLEKPKDAEKSANIAIGEKPKLGEPFLTKIYEIREWAEKAKDDPYYEITARTDEDDFMRPKSPKIRPPKFAVPQESIINKPDKPTKKPEPSRRNLTGKWRSNDGGIFFLRQIGDEIWWYGQSKDGGKTWSNVFQGRIKGNRIKGNWVDVPHGRTRNSGKMTLEILGNGKLKAIQKTGGFIGSEWIR